ncbi:MAG: 5'-3' exonuclease H3TH domain-containing protein, partial [bacterium]
KDLVQLVNDQITYWDFAKNQRYGLNIVKEKFGVYPEQIVDLLALMGDSVDNIPGVKGIGRKTAVRLLNEFRNLEDIYENIHSLGNLAIRGASAIKNNLIAGRGMAKLSKRLASLALDVPVVSDIRLLANRGAKKNLIEPLFGQLGFERILDRIPKWNPRKAAGYSRFG